MTNEVYESGTHCWNRLNDSGFNFRRNKILRTLPLVDFYYKLNTLPYIHYSQRHALSSIK